MTTLFDYRAHYGPVELGEKPTRGVSDHQWEIFCRYVRGTETMKDIAASLGVRGPSISWTIQKVHRRLRTERQMGVANADARASDHSLAIYNASHHDDDPWGGWR